MVLKRLKNMKKSFTTIDNRDFGVSDQEEYVEVDVGGSVGDMPVAASSGKIGIIIESISNFGDTEKVLRFLREGQIVLLKVKSIKEKDLGELKRVVERLKRTTLAQNGDIVGVEQDWLLLVPEHVTVHR